jgi:hypothetical protein
MIIMGGNPAEAHPVSLQHLLEGKELNKANFIVIDPRMTRTAAHANEYVRIRPGTETKDFTETVRLLCNLSKFVIVDITNPRSAPLELQATVPDYMVPFAPILQQGEKPFATFVDLRGQDCQARRGEVQRTPRAADQPTSRRAQKRTPARD